MKFSISLKNAKTVMSLMSLLAVASSAAQAGSLTSDQLTASQRHKMEEISSIFENSTPIFQYTYIQDISDGAGVTAGRLGFNTNAGDLLEVVQKYTVAKGGQTPLAKYIPCLTAIIGTSDYTCLFPSLDAKILNSEDFKNTALVNYDFGKDWTAATTDPAMIQVQDREVQDNVYDVADDWAKRLGIQTAFGYAVLFDTVIQMGGDEVTNAMGGMARRTEKAFAQTHAGQADPLHGANEAEWLKTFLIQRRETLHYGYNDQDVKNTTAVPYESYPRADSLLQLLAEKNPDLSAPIVFSYSGGPAYTITE